MLFVGVLRLFSALFLMKSHIKVKDKIWKLKEDVFTGICILPAPYFYAVLCALKKHWNQICKMKFTIF